MVFALNKRFRMQAVPPYDEAFFDPKPPAFTGVPLLHSSFRRTTYGRLTTDQPRNRRTPYFACALETFDTETRPK